jgi:hypothetical protein
MRRALITSLTMLVTTLVLSASTIVCAQMLVIAGSTQKQSTQLLLKVHPHSLSFGKTQPLSSVSRTVTLTNRGSAQIMVDTLSLASGVFSVPGQVCAGPLKPRRFLFSADNLPAA